MKPPPFDYARPAGLEEALDLLARHGDEAKVLAGGQSLVPLLNMRFARPGLLVDVNRLPGLDRIEEEDGVVRVGALVRQAAFGAAEPIRRLVPLAAEAVPYVGHFVTRNRGTVGGSIAHADARAELPVVLAALGGSVLAASRTGTRTIPAADLFVTHFTSSLEPEELLVETRWPAAAPGAGFAFEEFALRTGDFALGMTACALELTDGRVSEARVAVGAAVARPLLLEDVGALLRGERRVDERLAREAGRLASAAVEPSDGLHASAEYQRHLAGVVVGRAVLRAFRRAVEGGGA